jgi:hypothetical protein
VEIIQVEKDALTVTRFAFIFDDELIIHYVDCKVAELGSSLFKWIVS